MESPQEYVWESEGRRVEEKALEILLNKALQVNEPTLGANR